MKIQDLKSYIPHEKPLVMAGPCSAESLEQVLAVAHEVKKNPWVKVFRAGIWKPRTRPNTFEGLGELALPWLKEVKKETGLLTTTEVATAKHVELCLKNEVDILWIGARTTANPFSVQEIADSLKGVNIPVMVKNPINADLQLWIGALERLNQAGIDKLIAIHRGFSQAQKLSFRNDPLWRIPIELKIKLPDLPILNDPSHITGDRELVFKVAQKAMDLDFDGLMIETHPQPEKAWSDAAQQVTPAKLIEIINGLKLKSESCHNKNFDQEIEVFRGQIDRLDHEILEALKFRKQVVEKIAQAKINQNVTALQRQRFQELMEDRIQLGSRLGLDAELVKEIFAAIHEDSIRIQTDLFENSPIENGIH